MFYILAFRSSIRAVPTDFAARSRYAFRLNSEEEELPRNVVGGKPGVWRGAYDPEFYAQYMKSKENGLSKSLKKKVQSAKKQAIKPKKMIGGQAGVWMGAKDPEFLKDYQKLKELESVQSLNQTQKNVTGKVIGGQPGVWQGAKDPKFLREYLISKYSKKNMTKKHGTKKFWKKIGRKHQKKTDLKTIMEQLKKCGTKVNKTATKGLLKHTLDQHKIDLVKMLNQTKNITKIGGIRPKFPGFRPKPHPRRPGFYCKFPGKTSPKWEPSKKLFGKKKLTKLFQQKVQPLVKVPKMKMQQKQVLERNVVSARV